MKVFVGGSKQIGKLPESALRLIDGHIAQGDGFLVGDCHGVDLAVQKYLLERGEKNVTVYCSGEAPRHNVGDWQVVALNAQSSGYDFYAQKDTRMAQDADCGLMTWNGTSKGTARNIERLRELNKHVDIVVCHADKQA